MKIPLNWLEDFVILPKDSKVLTNALTMVGHMLDKKIVVEDQTVIDLELRGNRADCYSVYGIAREVGALFGKKVKPLTIENLTKVNALDVDLKIDTPLVRRAMVTEIKDVKIQQVSKLVSR